MQAPVAHRTAYWIHARLNERLVEFRVCPDSPDRDIGSHIV